MNFINPIIQVVMSIWVLLARHINYIKNIEENVQALKKKKENLTSLESDVSTDVDRAQRQGRNPKQEVNNWLENVNQVKDQVSSIEREHRENKRCLSGCLPNYYSYRKLSKRSLKLTVEVNDLINRKGLFVGDVAIDPPAAIARMLPTTSLKGTTAEKTFRDILDCLNDDKIRRIGIYGMGGVGKTTIMKKINNHLKDAKLFDTVIWVTVSKDLNLMKLQSDIASEIKLQLSEDHSIHTRSFDLHEALLRKKNYLLILDDLWSPLSLEAVGIPEPDVENGCKLVLTTRSKNVCGRMGTQIDIQVKALSQGEAWSLFQEKVGTNALHDSDIQHAAKQLAKECAGLPLAIITVAGALRNSNEIEEWRNALNQLRSSSMTEIEGMEEEVFKPLKFSYDFLRSNKMKACFLYCSLYSEDRSIKENELVERWIWEGLIGEMMENRQAEFDNGQSLLNELKRACMLESGDSPDTVKMHDLMRDMAIGVTRHNRSFMVKAGMGLENADKEWEEDVERISLMNNKIKMLSVQPRCPKLLTLLLNDNPISEIIPHSFFENMHSLRVLDLSGTKIKTLPDSVSDLENLHGLLLNFCKSLERVPSLAKLKKLRKLDLAFTCIVELPESLSDLENLQELILRSCANLKTVPSLAKLKELRKLDLTFACSEEVPESLSDLENLQELILCRCANLKTVPSLAKLKELRKLDLSYVCIEELPESLSDLENLQELMLYKCEKLKTVHTLAKLKKLRKLNLSWTCIEELPESLSDLENLQQLILYRCKKLKTVPSLAKLKELRKLDLSCVCIEELPESLSDLENLQQLILYRCKKLKTVPSLAKLKELRKLDLSFTCIEELPKGMERLVALDSLYLDHTKKLRRFPIGILPKLSLLEDFSMMGSSCLCTSNEAEMMEGRIGIKEVSGLTRLNCVRLDFVDLASFSCYVRPLQKKKRMELDLRVVKSSTQAIPSEDEDEDDKFLSPLLHYFFGSALKIREWHDIIRMSDFLSDLGLKIRNLGIHSCHGMECLVFAEANNNFLLFEMKKTFANLRAIKVSTCPKLRNLFSLRLLESLQILEYIKVEDCDMMEELVAEEEDDEIGEGAVNNDVVITLPHLKYLQLSSLPTLKSICSRALVCNSLTKIKLIQCPNLKKIPLCINEPPSGFNGCLNGNREWWDALEWNDLMHTKALLEPFFHDEEAPTKEGISESRELLGVSILSAQDEAMAESRRWALLQDSVW